MLNPWRVLGVHRQTSEEDIRKAYLDLARRCHPDALLKAGAKPEGLEFAQISEAYGILSNRAKLSSFLRSMIALCKECGTCKGKGATYEMVGFRMKIFKTCNTCGGAGVHIQRG